MKAILYYYCNPWKTRKSMTLMGIYKQTNKGIDLLAGQILKDIKEKQITVDPAAYNHKKAPTKTEITRAIPNLRSNDFNNLLNYAQIEIEDIRG